MKTVLFFLVKILLCAYRATPLNPGKRDSLWALGLRAVLNPPWRVPPLEWEAHRAQRCAPFPISHLENLFKGLPLRGGQRQRSRCNGLGRSEAASAGAQWRRGAAGEGGKGGWDKGCSEASYPCFATYSCQAEGVQEFEEAWGIFADIGIAY